ncbi:MAG: ribosome-binding factor A [Patescibacteria group bacterium]
MKPERHDRLILTIKRLAAEFLERPKTATGTPAPLITVSNVDLSGNAQRATIYLTVFPDESEALGLRLAEAARGPLRAELQTRLSLKRAPYLEVAIDEREKKRRSKNDAPAR